MEHPTPASIPIIPSALQGTSPAANIDYCGARNLLRQLAGHGFSETELKKIAARVASTMGADIILC